MQRYVTDIDMRAKETGHGDLGYKSWDGDGSSAGMGGYSVAGDGRGDGEGGGYAELYDSDRLQIGVAL